MTQYIPTFIPGKDNYDLVKHMELAPPADRPMKRQFDEYMKNHGQGWHFKERCLIKRSEVNKDPANHQPKVGVTDKNNIQKLKESFEAHGYFYDEYPPCAFYDKEGILQQFVGFNRDSAADGLSKVCKKVDENNEAWDYLPFDIIAFDAPIIKSLFSNNTNRIPKPAVQMTERDYQNEIAREIENGNLPNTKDAIKEYLEASVDRSDKTINKWATNAYTQNLVCTTIQTYHKQGGNNSLEEALSGENKHFPDMLFPEAGQGDIRDGNGVVHKNEWGFTVAHKGIVLKNNVYNAVRKMILYPNATMRFLIYVDVPENVGANAGISNTTNKKNVKGKNKKPWDIKSAREEGHKNLEAELEMYCKLVSQFGNIDKNDVKLNYVVAGYAPHILDKDELRGGLQVERNIVNIEGKHICPITGKLTDV
jgi:hypothetical protein